MKRYIRGSQHAVYQVDIHLADGTVEYFDTFTTENYAWYHIALAKSNPDSIYNVPKYDGAEWTVTKKYRD